MEPIAWKDEYAIGQSDIDSQHRELFGILNRVIATLPWDRKPEGEPIPEEDVGVISGCLQELIDYADAHFHAEEALLRQLNHPDLEYQRQQHQDFRCSLIDWVELFEEDPSSASLDGVTFLAGWLENHVLGVDKRITPHLVG